MSALVTLFALPDDRKIPAGKADALAESPAE
jgi:hypothetical protein